MGTTTPTIRGLPRPLARALEAHADRLDVAAIKTAYDLAVDAHAGQLRASGEEYALAQPRLDTATIIAALHLATHSLSCSTPSRH